MSLCRTRHFWALALLVLLIRVPLAFEQNRDLGRELIERYLNGQPHEAAELLFQRANPNAAHLGRPIVDITAQRGDLTTVMLLIDFGADLNVPDSTGRTALVEAAGQKNGAEIVKVLLDAGATPTSHALGQACWLGRTEVVDLLLDAGVSPDAGLPQAAQGRHLELVKLLLAKGARVNAATKDGNTALHLGALQGGFPVVQLLVTEGADPNARRTRTHATASCNYRGLRYSDSQIAS